MLRDAISGDEAQHTSTCPTAQSAGFLSWLAARRSTHLSRRTAALTAGEMFRPSRASLSTTVATQSDRVHVKNKLDPLRSLHGEENRGYFCCTNVVDTTLEPVSDMG